MTRETLSSSITATTGRAVFSKSARIALRALLLAAAVMDAAALAEDVVGLVPVPMVVAVVGLAVAVDLAVAMPAAAVDLEDSQVASMPEVEEEEVLRLRPRTRSPTTLHPAPTDAKSSMSAT